LVEGISMPLGRFDLQEIEIRRRDRTDLDASRAAEHLREHPFLAEHLYDDLVRDGRHSHSPGVSWRRSFGRPISLGHPA
jgi:hypothetical protein